MTPLFGPNATAQPDTYRDTCGCRWQDAAQTVMFSRCSDHQIQHRLVEMPEPIRDSWITRLLDVELDNFLREIARSGRGCRVEAKLALGPKHKDQP